MASIEQLHPSLGLVLEAGGLVLRGLADEHLPALCEAAAAGIHPAGEMPFATAWTDVPPAELAANIARYQWGIRASFTPAKWTLPLGVWVDGELAGVQALHTENFPVLRSAHTGSWLSRRFQGQGIGTTMRRAICAFAFDHLGAVEVTSAAYLDNPASLAVSRKVGYRGNGIHLRQRRGKSVECQQLRLLPSQLAAGPALTVHGLDPFLAAITPRSGTEGQ